MEYNKYPIDTFQTLVIGAGVLLTDFDPTTATVTDANILGPTSGGINFTATPSYKDFGEDIDNVPKNTKELKHLENWEVKMSGTLIAITPAAARWLAAAADLNTATGKITPRSTLDLTASTGDFRDIWLVADYSDKNETGAGKTAGYVAIKLMDALSTGGFQLQTADKEKGKFSFEFTGHYSKDASDTPPFEIYIKAGVALAPLTVASEAGTSTGKSKITVSGYSLGSGESYVYQTASGTAPSVDYGDDVSAWTTLTSGSEISPTSGHTKITVAVKDSNGKAVGGGSATLVIAQ